jgi:hypothetical protein
LIWALILIAHRQEHKEALVPATVGSTTITHNHPEEPISHFASGESIPDQVRIDRLESALKPYTHEKGDLLLLFGSADCAEMRQRTNEDLARERADNVSKMLTDSSLHPDFNPEFNIEIEALNQHRACQQSGDLRAVFPVLIHPQPAPSALTTTSEKMR